MSLVSHLAIYLFFSSQRHRRHRCNSRLHFKLAHVSSTDHHDPQLSSHQNLFVLIEIGAPGKFESTVGIAGERRLPYTRSIAGKSWFDCRSYGRKLKTKRSVSGALVIIADIYKITNDRMAPQVTDSFLQPASITVDGIMHFSIISMFALFVLETFAAPAIRRDTALCPAGLYNTPQCCDVDVLGVADLDCASRSFRSFYVVAITDYS